MELPRLSDLTATQQAAILAADKDTGVIPDHFPRVTVRALFMRHLVTRAEHGQLGMMPARLTINGQSVRAELEDRNAERRRTRR